MTLAARITRKPKSVEWAPVTWASSLPVRRFTIAEYHELRRGRSLSQRRRCELINGWIVAKMRTTRHTRRASTRLERRLRELLPRRLVDAFGTASQHPDERERTGTGYRDRIRPEDKYDGRHPGPKDIALVVEVSDSSLGRRPRRETRHRMPAPRFAEYWIVNVNKRRVEVYTQPRNGQEPDLQAADELRPRRRGPGRHRRQAARHDRGQRACFP